MSGALDDLLVLDFSKYLPGPYCTWLLGDLGARVIRIENRRELDKQAKVFGWNKLSDAERGKLRGNDIFARNKLSAAFDFSDPTTRSTVLGMIERADVVVEDYRPGVMDQMGFGYEALRAVNPRLIYCSVTLCGQTGPYRDKPGHDPVALAIAGAQSRIGTDPERPSFAGVPVADLLSGSNAAIGILTALHDRTRTGKGQLIDIAMSDSAMALIAPLLSRNPDLSKAPPRGLTRIDCGLWQTRDGYFLCTTDMEPRYWERFCQAIGRPDYVPSQLAADRWPEMRADLAEIFASRDLTDWLAILEAAGTQFAPVHDIQDALVDTHNIARGMVVEAVAQDGGKFRQIGSPIHLSGHPDAPLRPAAPPGHDTAAIMAEFALSQRKYDEPEP